MLILVNRKLVQFWLGKVSLKKDSFYDQIPGYLSKVTGNLKKNLNSLLIVILYNSLICIQLLLSFSEKLTLCISLVKKSSYFMPAKAGGYRKNYN